MACVDGITIPVFTSKADMRAFSRQQKRDGKTIALVPTMGYLHAGHLSLVQAARQQADVVVASIYVNPTQFSANEDFDVYPRDSVADRVKLQEAGCAAIFEPETLYHNASGDGANVVGKETSDPDSHETYVQVERLQLPLCGGSRPHFFRGVATVVSKLFHIVEPDVAVFGRKDFQQWRIITRMVRDLDFAVKIVGVPISREPDGIAMSSRNARLTPEARQDALCLSQGLRWAQAAAAGAGATSVEEVAQGVVSRIEAGGGKVDYVRLVDATSLLPLPGAASVATQPTLLALAAWFEARGGGTVRLIDNTLLGPALPDE